MPGSEKFKLKRRLTDMKYYYELVAPNGIVLVKSDAFASKDACLNAIARIKQYAESAKVVEDE